MSETMQAAFFAGPRKLEVREIPVPHAGLGEIVLDVRACGVCGSDLHQFEGRWEQPDYVPGHEVTGEVIEVGEGVCEWQVGDRVGIEPFGYCGRCCYCMAGRYYQCEQMGFLSLSGHGGFAERMVTPAYAAYRLPENLDYPTGALVEPLAVAVHGSRLANINFTDEVLVLGAGSIGLLTASTANSFGAHKVAITARHNYQKQAAYSLGVDRVLSINVEELQQQVKDNFTHGPSVVVETVGSAAGTYQLAVDLAGSLARVVFIGANTGTVQDFNFDPVMSKELTLYGSGAYAQIGTRRDFDVAFDLLAQKPTIYSQLITHKFELKDIQNAFELASHKTESQAIKVMMIRE